MAALTIDPAEVQRAENGERRQGRTFEAVTAGQAVYYDPDLKAWGKASAVSTLMAAGGDARAGIALSTALATDAVIQVQLDGDITLGPSAGIVVAKLYMLGAVAGSIYPVSDNKVTHYSGVFGVGAPDGMLRLDPFMSGVLPGSVVNDSLIVWAFFSERTDDTPWVSPIIDKNGYDEVTFFLLIGTLVDTDVACTVLLEHGDDASLADAAAVSDGEMISQTLAVAPETAAGFNSTDNDDGEVRKLGYASTAPKRYLQLTVTPANNTGSVLLSGYCELGAAASVPVTQT